ncbi:MAG: hypothetical protein S4CHLAM45_03500 [Chlamydiales bacterium]|nr:hypothetical protein [Chlamydiales bacterium]MCH9622467.1 hypothetical protein [Chlamydiales bacterium]
MKLKKFGSVDTVVLGKVSQKNLIPLPLSEIAYGLGAATTVDTGELLVGEGIIYNHVAYGYFPGKKWVIEDEVKTPFFVGIDTFPEKHFHTEHSITVDTLYSHYLEQFPKGFAIAGEVEFEQLSLAYLMKSPTTGKNMLNCNAIGQVELKNQKANIFGVVMTKSDPHLFYNNPAEKCSKALFYSHTHALVDTVPYHLLTHSKVKKSSLSLSPIDG